MIFCILMSTSAHYHYIPTSCCPSSNRNIDVEASTWVFCLSILRKRHEHEIFICILSSYKIARTFSMTDNDLEWWWWSEPFWSTVWPAPLYISPPSAHTYDVRYLSQHSSQICLRYFSSENIFIIGNPFTCANPIPLFNSYLTGSTSTSRSQPEASVTWVFALNTLQVSNLSFTQSTDKKYRRMVTDEKTQKWLWWDESPSNA